MKSAGRIIEEYGGWCAFFVGFGLSCFVAPEKYNYRTLIENFPAIGLGVFGFMLTFIAIILQSSNKTIDYMKEQTMLFKSFIEYNKRVVYLSAILTLYTYVATSISITLYFALGGFPVYTYLKIIGISFFWGLLSKLCTDTFFFIRSFYILLRQ